MPDPAAINQIVDRGANAAARGARTAQSATNEDAHGAGPFDVWTHTGEGFSTAPGHTTALPDELVKLAIGLLNKPIGPIQCRTSVDAIQAAMGQQFGATKEAAADIGKANGPLATAGAIMNTLTNLEQTISIPLSAIPFPALPAIRILDVAYGLPHAHNHPPNLDPPGPPVPLPSVGPVLPIPFVSGASTVLINGMPAGRCGDIGVGIWCGGFFPFYEIFLGSSSVWIEGMRAARLAVDITKHCTFTSPKPNDPPMGPMIGATLTASSNVVIGGIPMPSLTMMAIAGATKLLFKGIGKVVKGVQDWAKAARAAQIAEADAARVARAAQIAEEEAARAARAADQVAKLERDGAIVLKGTPEEVAAMREDLQKIASTKAGRDLLDHIAENKVLNDTKVEIEVLPESDYYENGGTGPNAYRPKQVPLGTPADSQVFYGPGADYPVGAGEPDENFPMQDSPSDVALYHELFHADNYAAGTNFKHLPPSDSWFAPDREEEGAVNSENLYRRERGLTQRQRYGHLP
jgi:hypothetical protein